jgi:hypothetical protein
MNDLARIRTRLRRAFHEIPGVATRYFLLILGLALVWLAVLTVKNVPVRICPTDATSTLTSMAEILTTIFAISISLLLVGLQFVSERYSVRVLVAVLYDPIIICYIIVYSVAIFTITGAVSLGYPAPVLLLPFSQFIMIYCVVYLVALVFKVPELLHPLRALNRLAERMNTTLCRQLAETRERPARAPTKQGELVNAIEDMLVASVARGDVQVFAAGLKHFEHILTAFITDTSKRLEHEDNKKQIRESPSYVFEYFLRPYQRLFWECDARRREEHLIYLCESLKELMIGLFKIKAFRAFDWTSRLYENAGLAGLEKGLSLFADYYVRSLENLVKVELTILDETTDLFPVAENKKGLPSDDRDLRTVKRILLDRVRYHRIEHISMCAEKASQRGMRFIANFYMSILSEVLDKLLSVQPIERRQSFTKFFLYQFVQAHKRCVDKGINPTTYTISMLEDTIENIKDPAERREFGGYVTDAYREMGIYSIHNGFYDDIMSWRSNGLYLIKDYPELATMVVDVLEEALKTLESRTSRENRVRYLWAREGLAILLREGQKHKRIKSRIGRLLQKYPRHQYLK